MEQNIKIVQKLSQDVINKICAGEVIHRPLNVVKELLENSIDAGATHVTVTLKNGGLKMITIQDNACGIRKEDLPIVCNRFTTSKLQNFDDLQSLSTFGFRGEALSSVSTVSHLTIQSKTADSMCGYKAEYFDGDLKPGEGASLKPVAMNQGTIIFVENLFFNMPTRKNALSSETTEFGLVLDMIQKYSLLHSGKISMTLKKSNDSAPLVNTRTSSTLKENIEQIFGEKIADKLLEATINNEKLGFQAKIHFTSSDLNLKRIHFILFINNRLVESILLKNSLKDLYRKYLMKGTNPFVLLFLSINSQNIDVNVHPTKNEVCFLYENEIVEVIIETVEKYLTDPTSSNFPHQNIEIKNPVSEGLKVLPVSFSSKNRSDKSPIHNQPNLNQSILSFANKKSASTSNENLNTSLKSPLNTSKNLSQKKQIRTDSQISRIDQYLKSKTSSSKIKRREFSYDSLKILRNEINQQRDDGICNMFKDSTFVGCINETFFLIQHKLNLIMINSSNINLELFYQLYLIDFGNFSVIQFREPIPLEKLIHLYFRQNCSDLTEIDDSIQQVLEILYSKSDMFEDYFSLKIDPIKKCLESIPRLIEDHIPLLGFLPDFLYHLAMNVNFNDESGCFHDIGIEIAKFYSKSNSKNDWNNLVEHRFYPLYKSIFIPSTNLASNQSIITLTDTSNLYKVFERC